MDVVILVFISFYSAVLQEITNLDFRKLLFLTQIITNVS